MTSDKIYIIQKAKEGDAKAMRLLYEEYYQYVLDYCHRYLMNYTLAKDLTQDIFMKVFEKLNHYKAEGDFGGWLNIVCRNFIISYIRKEKKNKFSALDANMNYDMADDDIEEDEFQSFKNNLSVDEIYGLLGQLDPKSRTIFNLYAIEGIPHKEIALQLEISEGTSKSQLSRARVKLKQLVILEIEKKKEQTKKSIQSLMPALTALITIIIKKMFYE